MHIYENKKHRVFTIFAFNYFNIIVITSEITYIIYINIRKYTILYNYYTTYINTSILQYK